MRHRVIGGRSGFTLVELLVVIAIIGVLVGLLLPALSSARASANASGSASNMSGFGRGFELYATNNNGVYSSGAFDHFRDGDVRTYGWVADLITSKVSVPGKALDAGSRNKINEKCADYMGASKGGDLAKHVDAGVGRWTTKTLADCSGETYFGGDAAAKEIWNEGYNSNYATTWHFSRGDPNAADGYSGGDKLPTNGDGPLSQTHLSQGLTTAARVALMGPARAGDGADAIVIAGSTVNPTTGGVSVGVINDFVGEPVVKVNDLLVESFNDGMNVPFTDTTMGGAAGVKVHEFNDIEPLHQPKTRVGTGGYAPILFADLHVEKVYDTIGETVTAGTTAGTFTVTETKGGDSYIGNGVLRDSAGKITGVAVGPLGFQEISDFIWIKRLRNRQSAAGSINE